MRSDTCDMQDDTNDRVSENQKTFGIVEIYIYIYIYINKK